MNYCLMSVLGAAALFASSTCGEIVYDNTDNYEGKLNDTLLESGDEIVLAGSSRLITEFAFEYFGNFAITGDESARLRFYEMNGPTGDNPFATPGTLLYDSGPFTISSGFKTVNVADLSVLIPGNRFTWSVQFSGVTEAERSGLLFYDPPTVGSSDDYFWQLQNGTWLAVASADTGNNFGARVTAVAAPVVVPLRIGNVRNQGGAATLTVTGATPGKAYTLEFKSSVTEAGWQRAPVQTRATGTELTLVDPTAQGAQFRLYRVVEQNTTIARSNQQASIVSFAVAGRRYALERTTNFTNWTPVAEQTANGNTVTFQQPITPGTNEFFRVVELN